MGYNKTPKSVIRVREYLELLHTSNNVVTISTKDPKALAYAIHEGLYAAEFLRWPKYASLRKSFEITTDTEKGKVICKPKAAIILQEGTFNLEDITDWMEAIAAIVKYTDVDIPLLFPNLDMADIELFKGWCNSNNREVVNLPIGVKVVKRKVATTNIDMDDSYGNS